MTWNSQIITVEIWQNSTILQLRDVGADLLDNDIEDLPQSLHYCNSLDRLRYLELSSRSYSKLTILHMDVFCEYI